MMVLAQQNNRTLTCFIVLELCLLYFTALIPPHSRLIHPTTSLQRLSITPSQDLVYQDCYRYAGNLRSNLPHAGPDFTKWLIDTTNVQVCQYRWTG